jgi:hypothetical protein
MDTTQQRRRITAAGLLAMQPAAAQQLTQGLNEANRKILLEAAIKRIKLRAEQGIVPTSAEAAAFKAMFCAMGPARLVLEGWTLATSDIDLSKRTAVQAATDNILHACMAERIVTGIFGVPVGEAGIGTVPKLGVTDSDAFDIHASIGQPDLIASFYRELVIRAEREGVIVVDDDPMAEE